MADKPGGYRPNGTGRAWRHEFPAATPDYGFLTQHPIHSTMADREHSPTHGPEVPAESHDPATLGNRPATGARVVDHATTLPGGFGGGAEATDFLGLSQELTGIDSGPLPPGHAVPSGPTGRVGGRTHPGEYPTEPESSASWLLQPDPIVGEGDAHSEETSEHETDHVHGRTRSFSTWHKVAAALLVGAGATFGYRMWERSQSADSTEPSAPTIAHAPKARPPALPAGTGELSDPTGGSAAGTGAGTGTTTPDAGAPTVPDVAASSTEPAGGDVEIDLSPAPAAPRLGQQRLAEWVEQHGWSPGAEPSGPVSGTLLTMLLGLGTGSSPMAMPSAGSYAPDPSGSPELAADPLSTTEPRILRKGSHAEATPAKSPVGGLRLASPEELAGIWPGDTVPMDALDGETRLLTPGVGQVHVIMKTGDIFDGRLYAIGTGQVWLESAIGRLALAGKRVQAITLVTSEEVNGKTVEDLPRMRVRTPGGIFFGKVVAHEGDRVTILTENGGRITLVSRDVESAPLGDTRVIGRVEKP